MKRTRRLLNITKLRQNHTGRRRSITARGITQKAAKSLARLKRIQGMRMSILRRHTEKASQSNSSVGLVRMIKLGAASVAALNQFRRQLPVSRTIDRPALVSGPARIRLGLASPSLAPKGRLRLRGVAFH
jgi:hypothetical protein